MSATIKAGDVVGSTAPDDEHRRFVVLSVAVTKGAVDPKTKKKEPDVPSALCREEYAPRNVKTIPLSDLSLIASRA